MESLNKISHDITMKSIENNTFRPSTELSTEDLQRERSTKNGTLIFGYFERFSGSTISQFKNRFGAIMSVTDTQPFPQLVIETSLLKIN